MNDPDTGREDADAGEDGGCPKCGRVDVETDTVAATSGGLAALAELQNRSFTVVRCRVCDYCEFYGGRFDERYVDLFLGREWLPPAERETAEKRSDGPVHYCASCGATVEADAAACPKCDRAFA